MQVPGKRIQKTRLVRTERYIIAVNVEAVIPDADLSEPVYESETVELLLEVESRARSGDVD